MIALCPVCDASVLSCACPAEPLPPTRDEAQPAPERPRPPYQRPQSIATTPIKGEGGAW